MPADFTHGIPIGKFESVSEIMIYNHWDITVIVHDTLEGHHRIVGFEVEPYSIYEGVHRMANDPGSEPKNQYLKADEEFTFSYRIITRRDPKTSWSMRMDHYVKTGNNDIHMASILWSILAIACAVIILGVVLERSISRDFASLEVLRGHRRTKRDERRNGDITSEEDLGLTSNKAKEVNPRNVAWKKLQGDVFRRPEFSSIYCVTIGIGI